MILIDNVNSNLIVTGNYASISNIQLFETFYEYASHSKSSLGEPA
jgi:hypothetical protein